MPSTADAGATSSAQPDAGLFGPDSVTWRIHRDPSMLVAGVRALLLQAVHPQVMAGFDAGSTYRGDPWGRLRRTGEWIGTVTYGSTEEAEAAGAFLRRMHARLPSFVMPGSDRVLRPDDPAFLLWVHCTEVESFLSTFRRCGGRLSAAEADRYVDEMRASARLVGLDTDRIPRCVRDLEAYFTEVRPQLRVTPEARRTTAGAFVPPMPAWVALGTPARPAWATLMTLAAAMLPRWARRLYGLPGLPLTDASASLTGRALRRSLLALPSASTTNPDYREARRRMAASDLSSPPRTSHPHPHPHRGRST